MSHQLERDNNNPGSPAPRGIQISVPELPGRLLSSSRLAEMSAADRAELVGLFLIRRQGMMTENLNDFSVAANRNNTSLIQ